MITSALCSSWSPRRVINPGSPGPAPTNHATPSIGAAFASASSRFRSRSSASSRSPASTARPGAPSNVHSQKRSNRPACVRIRPRTAPRHAPAHSASSPIRLGSQASIC